MNAAALFNRLAADSGDLDYYLVLTGPKATAKDVRTVRAWRIDSAYLFDAEGLLAEQRARGVKTGVAAGVLETQWQTAEVYPAANNSALTLTAEQRGQLELFAG